MQYLAIRKALVLLVFVIAFASSTYADTLETYHVVQGDKLWDIVGREWKLKTVGMYEEHEDVRILKTPYSVHHLLPGTRIIGPAKYFKKHDVPKSSTEKENSKDIQKDSASSTSHSSATSQNTHDSQSGSRALLLWAIIGILLAVILTCRLIFLVFAYINKPASEQASRKATTPAKDLQTTPIYMMNAEELCSILMQFTQTGLPNERFAIMLQSIAYNKNIRLIPNRDDEKLALQNKLAWHLATGNPLWDTLVAIADKSSTPHEQHKMLEKLLQELISKK